MKFEVINPDGRVVYNTEHKQCIDISDIDVQSAAGYKFRLDGKVVSRNKLKEWLVSTEHDVPRPETQHTSATTRSVKQIKCLNNGKIYKNMSEAGRDLGIDSALISYSLKVNRPTKGFSFEFVSND